MRRWRLGKVWFHSILMCEMKSCRVTTEFNSIHFWIQQLRCRWIIWSSKTSKCSISITAAQLKRSPHLTAWRFLPRTSTGTFLCGVQLRMICISFQKTWVWVFTVVCICPVMDYWSVQGAPCLQPAEQGKVDIEKVKWILNHFHWNWHR